VTEGLKSTATTVENTLNAALDKCTPASPAPTAKKAR